MADTYLQHVQELSRLTERARASVLAGEWDDLLVCLEQRQAVMETVDRLTAGGGDLPAGESQEALRLLQQVVAMDAQLSSDMESSLGQARAQLQAADAARTSISAYQRSARPTPDMIQARFVDRQR